MAKTVRQSGIQVAQALGARLKQHRQQTGDSARLMAALLEVSPSNYLRIEAGQVEPGIGTVKRILDIMGVTFEEATR